MRIERSFRVSCQRLFDAWTRPAELKSWFGPPGCEVESVELDLRIGGNLAIVLRPAWGCPITISGTFQEIAAPSRLVFTWNIASSQGVCPTLIRIEFVGRSEGATVRLHQELLPDADTLEAQRRVIECCLDQLGAFLASSEDVRF